jgi:hypothetical protein
VVRHDTLRLIWMASHFEFPLDLEFVCLRDGLAYPNSHALISFSVFGSGPRRYRSRPALRLLSVNGVGRASLFDRFDVDALVLFLESRALANGSCATRSVTGTSSFAQRAPDTHSDSSVDLHLLDSALRSGGDMSFDKDAWIESCRENARILETEINRLQTDYADPLGFWHRYSDFWEHARRISTMFKTLKPLFREDRERLWSAFSAACEDNRKAQAREREARLNDSREKRDLVMSKIREAYFQAKGAADSAEFAEADALLSEALAWMKNGWEGFNTITQLISPILSSGIMTREDREECWAEWKEAKDLLRLRRDEFYAEMHAARVGRWRDCVEENDELIETLQTEIDECEELERSARTEEFAERIRDRIEAKTQKIAGLEERNAQLECKIAAVES